ncbi:hypothetical protein SAMN05421780_1097 [Flexibacter flexilis DSM 6793]|uniref:MAE-28990/MAE-18760-like HEPN domain-containing protein n=1 Tax=Flexibacter flexilis DSM 6793 TaxID=927664 RepID=A0A1I1LK65_9BACT|nr:MAE_28990/MAE_18760 family HEPN-like nuclease [Flexibacter flexilis]SFC73421.1 hypothetical protein SAMN05421780_1097 [Flexibacter flexilis DSM 6793]
MIRDEFNTRKAEIDSYYEILRIIELESPNISAYNLNEGITTSLPINSEKICALRSTAYLLLYNLIESTVYNSIVSIFDSISDDHLKYFDVINEVQKYWLNQLYKHDDKKKKEAIIETIMNIAIQIQNDTISLVSNEISYGGSLDARTIQNTAQSMNIEIKYIHQMYNASTHGTALSNIKQKRNWLAHGEKSFTDVGRQCSTTELTDAKDRVYEYLDAFITSVEKYINDKKYKK